MIILLLKTLCANNEEFIYAQFLYLRLLFLHLLPMLV